MHEAYFLFMRQFVILSCIIFGSQAIVLEEERRPFWLQLVVWFIFVTVYLSVCIIYTVYIAQYRCKLEKRTIGARVAKLYKFVQNTFFNSLIKKENN